MFEKFTENGRKAFAIANREAQRFHHEGVETEHVLLGLIKEGESVTLQIFKALDVDLKNLKLQCQNRLKFRMWSSMLWTKLVSSSTAWWAPSTSSVV